MEFKSFNSSLLFEQFRGDEGILLEVIEIFDSSARKHLLTIKESIQTRDADKLRISAHTLKGVLGNFFAEEGARLSHELEMCGKKGEFTHSEELFYSLETFVDIFLDEIASVKSSLTAAG